MQIADIATYLGEEINSKGNNSSLPQCVQSKACASFSEIISFVKTIINQHHLYIYLWLCYYLNLQYRIKFYMNANHGQICLQLTLIVWVFPIIMNLSNTKCTNISSKLFCILGTCCNFDHLWNQEMKTGLFL